MNKILEKIVNNSTVLFLIIILAVFFRLFELGTVPPHPSLDEVSTGYNAYSLLQTGKDEYAKSFPLLLRSYDDWRPAMYAYLVAFSVKVLGLNVLAVRLPSAALSVLTVVVAYFLLRELLVVNSRSKILNYKLFSIETLFLFLLAISPWHIYISRLGHEVNLAFSLLVFATYFFFRYINKLFVSEEKLSDLVFAAMFFALSFSSYQSQKIIVPLFAIVLFGLFKKELLSRKKNFLIAVFMGTLFVLPALLELFKPYGLIRFQGTNLFANSNIAEISSIRLLEDIKNSNFLGLVFDNRRILYKLTFVRAWLSHLDPVWLFTNRGDEIFKIPNFGLFHLIELPFLIYGFFAFLKESIFSKKIKLFLLFWIGISILPGALTTGYPHAMRIFTAVLPFGIITAVGIFAFFTWFVSQRYAIRTSLTLLVIVSFASSLLWFYHSYFVLFKRELAYQFQYGVVDAISYAIDNEDKFDRIIVSNKNNLFQSYMFYLFTKKYDPFLYQKLGGTISGGFDKSHRIGKFEFVNPSIEQAGVAKALFVVSPAEIQEEKINIVSRFKYPDGKDAVWLATTK